MQISLAVDMMSKYVILIWYVIIITDQLYYQGWTNNLDHPVIRDVFIFIYQGVAHTAAQSLPAEFENMISFKIIVLAVVAVHFLRV